MQILLSLQSIFFVYQSLSLLFLFDNAKLLLFSLCAHTISNFLIKKHHNNDINQGLCAHTRQKTAILGLKKAFVPKMYEKVVFGVPTSGIFGTNIRYLSYQLLVSPVPASGIGGGAGIVTMQVFLMPIVWQL